MAETRFSTAITEPLSSFNLIERIAILTTGYGLEDEQEQAA